MDNFDSARPRSGIWGKLNRPSRLPFRPLNPDCSFISLYFTWQPIQQCWFIASQSALPQYNHAPTRPYNCLNILLVTFNIFLEFCQPAVLVARGDIAQAASFMPVPEATMYKNHHAITWQANIWGAWQRFFMQTIPKTAPMEKSPHFHFRLRIFAFDPRHHTGSRLYIDYIHYSW